VSFNFLEWNHPAYHIWLDLPYLARLKYANNASAIDLTKEIPGRVDIPRLRKGKVGGFFWYVYLFSRVLLSDVSSGLLMLSARILLQLAKISLAPHGAFGKLVVNYVYVLLYLKPYFKRYTGADRHRQTVDCELSRCNKH
jgi:hypothetical protein